MRNRPPSSAISRPSSALRHLLCAVCLLHAAFSFAATTFTWTGESGGDLLAPDNWGGKDIRNPAYHSSSYLFAFRDIPAGEEPYRVTVDSRVGETNAIGILSFENVAADVTIDLGGSCLFLTNKNNQATIRTDAGTTGTIRFEHGSLYAKSGFSPSGTTEQTPLTFSDIQFLDSPASVFAGHVRLTDRTVFSNETLQVVISASTRGRSILVDEGASLTLGAVTTMGGTAKNWFGTNTSFTVRNASYRETMDATGYRGGFGPVSGKANEDQYNRYSNVVFRIENPLAFSKNPARALIINGCQNALVFSGPNARAQQNQAISFAYSTDASMRIADRAFVRAHSNAGLSFTHAVRPTLTVSGGARFEASTNIVQRPVSYAGAEDVALNVLDGGCAFINFAPFSIDGTNTVVSLSNGTFHVSSCWQSGSCSITPFGSGFGLGSTFDAYGLTSGGLPAAVHSPAIALAGRDAKFLVTGRFIAGRKADEAGVGQHPAELRFTVPPEGWAAAPLCAEESVDPGWSARKNGELRIRDEVVFRVDARKFIAANRNLPATGKTRIVPLVRGVTNLTSKSTLQYAYEADVEALNAHAALQPANRLRLVDHRDAHGNVVGIDLEVAYEKGLRLFVR